MSIGSFPVEAGHVMMFARSVGDPNPIYYDAAYAARSESGSIIAPPTFVQAGAHWDSEHALHPKMGEPEVESGRTPADVDIRDSTGGRGFHAEQHFEFIRPVRVGDVLHVRSVPGKQWEKVGRTGKLTFSDAVTEYRDEADELVVRARYVSVHIDEPNGDDPPR